jgi:hypothetical protein
MILTSVLPSITVIFAVTGGETTTADEGLEEGVNTGAGDSRRPGEKVEVGWEIFIEMGLGEEVGVEGNGTGVKVAGGGADDNEAVKAAVTGKGGLITVSVGAEVALTIDMTGLAWLAQAHNNITNRNKKTTGGSANS